MQVQFDVVSERHSFASAMDTLPRAAVSGATRFTGASAVGGFLVGAGVSAGAGIGAGSGAAFAGGGASPRGAGVSTRGVDDAAGLDGWRNPNHHVPNATSSTAPIAIAVVGRLDGEESGETGDAVRVASVGFSGGGSGARFSVASRSGGDAGEGDSGSRATGAGRGGGAGATVAGTTGAATAAGAGLGAPDSEANGSSPRGTVPDNSIGLPIASQKSLRF